MAAGVRPPRAEYAWNGDVAIAYGVVGDGPIDIVYVQGYVSDVEMMWECPQAAAFMERLSGWARLITLDRRGVGMSDRFSPGDLPPLEDAARDVLAVLDAVGSKKAALFGHHEGGQLCAMLAATAPERVRSLSLYTTPISTRQIAYEDGDDDAEIVRSHEEWHRTFGTPAFDKLYFEILAPSYMHDVQLYAFFSRLQRHVASPSSSTGFGDSLRGIAVHVGARVAAEAQASDVLVSQTVKDLVAGSGLVFEDAGEHELKGIADRWHLYRAVPAP